MKKLWLCLLFPVLLAASCPSSPPAQQREKGGLDLSYIPAVPDTENDNHVREPMSEKTALITSGMKACLSAGMSGTALTRLAMGGQTRRAGATSG